jgi:hypothetical protein
VLEAFTQWELRQAGLFTFSGSSKHLGLYQKHGFSLGAPTVIAAKPTDSRARSVYELAVGEPVLDEVRDLTHRVFPGLDLRREIVAARAQGIGETILVRGDRALDGMAVCHRGAGSEAGSDTCYVKFAAARPGEGAGERFERLLDACEAFAADSGLVRLVAGVSTGRLDGHRRLLARGFEVERVGVSMWLRSDAPRLDTPDDYVVDDLR